ncbi:hypothetical protein B0H14DRAFT_77240 [Mycena olivaceomarginata]|nr:hypothetical protein B0H14DRAFT_77240 [Mycena olivaceomarginata]
MAVEVPAAGLSLSESHPLSEELSSLRALVAHFQNEAHTASINLQRHALDTSAYTARIAQLEGENKLLRAELGVLRDNPAPPPSSSLQSGAPSSVFSSAFASPSTANAEKERETVAELTLALRALSAKHTLALASLATATQSLTDATLRTRQAEHTADEAYALAARRRAREAELEDALRERGEDVARAREEARRSDAVVREYAGLVRRLEGRSPAAGRTSFALGHTRGVSGSGSVDAGSTPTLVEPAYSSFAPAPAATNGDADAKPTSDLEAGPNDALDWEKRAAALTASCTKLELALAASHTLVAELGTELARAKYEREVARIEDGGAGAVVERYMCVCVQSLLSPFYYYYYRFSRFGPFLRPWPGRRRPWYRVLLVAVLACFRFRPSRRRAAHLWYALCRSVRSFSFSFFPVHMHRRVFGHCFSPRGFLGRIPSPRPTPLATSSPLFLLLQHLLHFFLRQARPAGSLTVHYLPSKFFATLVFR